MNKQIKIVFLAIIGVVAINVSTIGAQPRFGTPTVLQSEINALFALLPVEIAGNQIKITLEGNFWRGQVNGADALAGDFNIVETATGAVITINQSWAFVDTGRRAPRTGAPIASWIRTPGPQIVFEYFSGPPASLTRVSDS